jgi:methyl-accepting chemotaxis protein
MSKAPGPSAQATRRWRLRAERPNERANALISKLADDTGTLGVELVDIAGNVDAVSDGMTDQVRLFAALRAGADDMREENHGVATAAATARERAHAATVDVDDSRRALATSLTGVHELVRWVESIDGQLQGLAHAVSGVSDITRQVETIARATHILALNARIEAARSGEAGQGFAVIADSVRELADQTIHAAADIDGTLEDLTGQIRALGDEGAQARTKANSAQEAAKSIGTTIDSVSAGMADIDQHVASIADAAVRNGQQVDNFIDSLDGLGQGVEAHSRELEVARERVNSLLDLVETIIGLTAETGAETGDMPFVRLAQSSAAKIAAVFNDAVKSGEMSVEDLFDEKYAVVPGTDPEQRVTRFTEFTDRVLPRIQEPALDVDPRIVFAATVDRNGYLPTHNLVFSKKQGPDPVWNAANCRNRRIFNDRTGLSAGRNTAPFLLQTYRRDMGGGRFVLMKDVSAPITVAGRHWGGIRIAYRVKDA